VWLTSGVTHESPGDEPGAAARGLLEHGQAPEGASLGVGHYEVEELQVVAVPDAKTSSSKDSSDPGAVIRGPLIGDEAPAAMTTSGPLQSPQEGAGAGIPHA
jgi:hypothetical protein